MTPSPRRSSRYAGAAPRRARSASCSRSATPSTNTESRPAVRAALPHVAVCTSFEVQPEFREFERFSTTVLNAYLQPVLGRYLATLEEGLSRVAPAAAIGINQSSGGLMSPARARALPVRTALSGPAAGAIGAAHSAKLSGRRNVITLDMGGTSADVAADPRLPGRHLVRARRGGLLRAACPRWTSRRWERAAARSRGSTATGCSRWVRRARARTPVRRATGAAAASPR